MSGKKKASATQKPASELDVLTAPQAAQIASLSLRVVMDALRSGELKGKNYAGRKGWVTTRRALSDWIENGNQGV